MALRWNKELFEYEKCYSFNNFLDGPPPKKLKPRTFTISDKPAKLVSINVKKTLKIPINPQILKDARRILENDEWEYINATKEDLNYLLNKIDVAIKYDNLIKLKKEPDEIQKKQIKILNQHYDEKFKNIKNLKLPKKMYDKTKKKLKNDGKEIPSEWFYRKGEHGHRNISAAIKLYVKFLRPGFM